MWEAARAFAWLEPPQDEWLEMVLPGAAGNEASNPAGQGAREVSRPRVDNSTFAHEKDGVRGDGELEGSREAWNGWGRAVRSLSGGTVPRARLTRSLWDPPLAWPGPLVRGTESRRRWAGVRVMGGLPSPQAWECRGRLRARRGPVKGLLTMTDGGPSAMPIRQDGEPGTCYKYLGRGPAQECKWWR